jgi:hypothetical protein
VGEVRLEELRNKNQTVNGLCAAANAWIYNSTMKLAAEGCLMITSAHYSNRILNQLADVVIDSYGRSMGR